MNHKSRASGGDRLVALLPLVLVALFSVVFGTASTDGARAAGAVPVRSCPHVGAPAGIFGMVPGRAPFGCTTPAGSSGPSAHVAASSTLGSSYNGGNPPLLNGGGAVVGTSATAGENTVHALFWAPAGYSFPAGYESGVTTFLNDVAVDSGKASNVYSVLTQYTGGQLAGTPHLHYDIHAGAPVDVSAPYPTTGGCTPDVAHGEAYSACITDQQMHAEISSVLSSNGLATGMGDIYLLLFPPNVESCVDGHNAAAGGTCSDTYSPGFCGYHSAYSDTSGPVLYANIPYPTAYYYTCLTSQAPSGSAALSSSLSLISHEHNETVTDPLGNAWVDSVQNENGDECAWNFGTPLGGTAGHQWNQVVNGNHYYLQQEFSNENYALDHANGCALTQSLPIASLGVTTAQPTATVATAFDGSGSTDPNVANGISGWSWTFGDSTPAATVAAPTHVFASAGIYTVTLTVTDVDGFSAVASRQVTVAQLPPPTPPSFTSASPPLSATVGKAYHYNFAASGAPAPTYTLSSGPGWLGISAVSGAVSGTPPSGTTAFTYSVTIDNGVGSATVGPFTVTVGISSSPRVGAHGYWLVGSDGGIFSFGSAGFHGSTGNFTLQRPVVGITPTTDQGGYWLVASDGGIFAFGDSGFFGSLPGLGFAPAGTTGGRPALAAPIVAMVPSSDGGGYFMVAADGGVFAFGDAKFVGSCPGIGGCAGSAVAVVPDASGNGYWLITAAGSVYAFGDANFFGSPPHRAAAVTSAVRTPDGGGYWILFADGRVAGFGDAGNFGDAAGTLGGDRATAVWATADGTGYWVATAAGVVDSYGTAPSDGSMAGAHLNAPIIAASGW